MIVTTSKMLLITFAIFLFSGCSQKEVLFKDKPVYINVPVFCEVPEVVCKKNDENTTFTEVVENLAKCNQDLRKAIEVCKKDKK